MLDMPSIDNDNIQERTLLRHVLWLKEPCPALHNFARARIDDCYNWKGFSINLIQAAKLLAVLGCPILLLHGVSKRFVLIAKAEGGPTTSLYLPKHKPTRHEILDDIV